MALPTPASAENRIMTFFSAYQVLKAEKLLLQEGIAVAAIAAPRFISTDCGICIRLRRMDEERAREVLDAAKIEINGVFDERQSDDG